MNSLKSFVKNIAEKAQADFPTIRNLSSEDSPDSGSGEVSAEGFLCPQCMQGFRSPEDLQSHYVSKHSAGGPVANFADLKEEVRELQTTLKEEEWYSAELKKEVERLSHAVQNSQRDVDAQENGCAKLTSEERTMFEAQVAALDEAKGLLTKEVSVLKEHLEDSNIRYASVTNKVSIVSAENVVLKASLDEMTGLKAATDEKLKILETVLSERNNTDDVAVLRRELRNVQKLMVSDLGDQAMYSELVDENEKLRSEVRRLNEVTRDTLNNEGEELKVLLQASKSEATTLKDKLQKSESALNEANERLKKVELDASSKNTEFENNLEKIKQLELKLQDATSKKRSSELENEKLQSRLSNQDKKLADMEDEISKSKKALEEQAEVNDSLRAENHTLNGSLEAINRQLESKALEVSELRKEVSDQKETNTRLDRERETLLSKIEAGEGMDTALQQLKQQNAHLTDQLANLSKEKSNASASFESALNKAHTELNDSKSSLAKVNEVAKKAQRINDELESKLDNAKKELARLETDLQAKSEQLLSSESSLLSVKRDSEEQIASLVAKLGERTTTCQSLEKTLSEKTQLAKEEKDKYSNLNLELNKLQENKSKLESELKDVALKLKSKELEVTHLENDKLSAERSLSSLKSDLDGQHKIVQDLEAKLDNLKSVEKNAGEIKTHLDATLRDLGILKEENQRVSNDFASKSSELVKVENELKEVRLQMIRYEDTMKDLNVRLNETEGLLKEKNIKSKRDEENILQLNCQLNEIQTELIESKKTLKDFLTTVEANVKTIAMLEEEKNDIGIRLKDKISMLDKLNEQFLSLEATSLSTSSELVAAKLQLEENNKAMDNLKSSFSSEKQKLNERISDLEGAKSLLITSKVEMERLLEDSNEKLAKTLEELQRAHVTVESNQKDCASQIQKIKTEMASQEKDFRQRLEAEANRFTDLSKQIQTLKDEAAESKSSAEKAELRVSELNAQFDSALSNKLELEAKVEAASDERRSLLERCLRAESQLERTRSDVVELRRKLDDSQAALHELGRENQSIQVELAKQSCRKWADDSEVTSCLSCSGSFSLTNRKHHCRNCGKIFCADCSSKQAAMPDYKKPQRVCDGCFSELQQNK